MVVNQARFSLQQAGMYGVPQSRRRFFIWGVLRGHTLPQFPQVLLVHAE
jgi:site-specific DNA-cytosine methylase